jgi:hypothetical protein
LYRIKKLKSGQYPIKRSANPQIDHPLKISESWGGTCGRVAKKEASMKQEANSLLFNPEYGGHMFRRNAG